jgi:hypothetical protein
MSFGTDRRSSTQRWDCGIRLRRARCLVTASDPAIGPRRSEENNFRKRASWLVPPNGAHPCPSRPPSGHCNQVIIYSNARNRPPQHAKPAALSCSAGRGGIRDGTVGPARPGTRMLAIVARGRAPFIFLAGRDFAQLDNDRDRDVDKPDRKAVRAGELESRDGPHVGRSGYAKFI